MIEPTEVQETPAERMYKKHLFNVSKYQKNNKEKIGKKQKEYLIKIKQDEPEKYKEIQAKRHAYYIKRTAEAAAKMNVLVELEQKKLVITKEVPDTRRSGFRR